MRRFEPMTLANMRQNGVRAVIASCANCGRSADVYVGHLARDPHRPEAGNRLRCSHCGGKTISTRLAWHYGDRPPRHPRLSARTASDVLRRPPQGPPVAQQGGRARPSPKNLRRPPS